MAYLGDAAKAVEYILTDPALPSIADSLVRLHDIEVKNPSTGSTSVGIGLRNVVKPLQVYVWTQEAPWRKWALLGIAIGLPLAIGYTVGRRR